MTCSWRWFVQPETAISTNRNGSSTPDMLFYYPGRAAKNRTRIKRIQYSDYTGQPFWIGDANQAFVSGQASNRLLLGRSSPVGLSRKGHLEADSLGIEEFIESALAR